LMRRAVKTDWTRRFLWVTIDVGVMMFRGAREMTGPKKDAA
jgi:hypothetical protein